MSDYETSVLESIVTIQVYEVFQEQRVYTRGFGLGAVWHR